jgi:hypothetical protein
MTEAEWLECKYPPQMLAKLRRASDRKLRLFAVACCRRVGQLFPHPSFHDAVAAVERFADGRADWAEVVGTRELVKAAAKAQRQAERSGPHHWSSAQHKTYHAVLVVNHKSVRHAASASSGEVVLAASFAAALAGPAAWPDPEYHERTRAAQEAENLAHCELVRDIFGRRLRPAAFPAQLRKPVIIDLATAVYEARAFERLPILADALEEAGCIDTAVLSHLRGPGSHVRGCWVLDLVLGRE